MKINVIKKKIFFRALLLAGIKRNKRYNLGENNIDLKNQVVYISHSSLLFLELIGGYEKVNKISLYSKRKGTYEKVPKILTLIRDLKEYYECFKITDFAKI